MTRMRDAAMQLLSAASSARDQLAQHNRLLILELEEARARVRVLQVCNPAPCTLFLMRFACRLFLMRFACRTPSSTGQTRLVSRRTCCPDKLGRGPGLRVPVAGS
jgi:hypothetical protein